MQVIIVISDLLTKFVAIEHDLLYLTPFEFDLYEGHHHSKLASAILLTKFGNHSAMFTTFDLR